jgi:hypothetical protein
VERWHERGPEASIIQQADADRLRFGERRPWGTIRIPPKLLQSSVYWDALTRKVCVTCPKPSGHEPCPKSRQSCECITGAFRLPTIRAPACPERVVFQHPSGSSEFSLESIAFAVGLVGILRQIVQ